MFITDRVPVAYTKSVQEYKKYGDSRGTSLEPTNIVGPFGVSTVQIIVNESERVSITLD